MIPGAPARVLVATIGSGRNERSMTRPVTRVGDTRRVTLTRRVAAAVALLALAGAVVLLVVVAATNWAGILVALVAVLAGVSAAWIALSRRGATRWAALGCVVVAVGLLAWGFILADLRPLRIALVT